MKTKNWPLLAALAAYLLSLIAVRPWGDYPLNDDWIYAHVAHVFFETGVIRMDPSAAPALVGQALMVAPFAKLFGFSLSLLRGVSMGMGLVSLILFGEILGLFAIKATVRALVLLAIAANPLFFYFCTAYMTEIYGMVPLLLATFVWFRDRKIRDASGTGAPISWPAVLITAGLSGFAFWTRQFFAMGYPCLAFALLWRQFFSGDRAAFRALLLRLGAGMALLLLAVKAYFVWARASGNLKDEFMSPLHTLLNLDLRNPLLYVPVFVVYLTAFCAPFLILDVGRRFKKGEWGWLHVGLALVWAAALEFAVHLAAGRMPQLAIDSRSFNRGFPYLGNVIRDAGIGPMTLTDTYLYRAPGGPSWPLPFWEAILVFLCLLSGGWWLTARDFIRARTSREPGEAARHELAVFGFLLMAVNTYVVTKAFKFAVYDRYLLICLVGAVLFWAAQLREGRGTKGWGTLANAALIAVWFFTLGGIRDEFRWNDARWELYRSAGALGLNPTDVDGGYEVNGWTSFEEDPKGRHPLAVDCPSWWNYCHAMRYRIGMNLYAGDRALASREVSFAFGRAVPMYLIETAPRLSGTDIRQNH